MTSVTPITGEWRPGHVPRLSYRNSAVVDPSHLSPHLPEGQSVGYINTEIPAWRIPAIRQQPPSPRQPKTHSSSSKTPAKSRSNPTPVTLPQSQKKKSSLFGGLFAKEASSAALEQVAAQLIAQHGELSPRAVPGVSSQKMPDFVPKVNSKWDGLPEAVKLKEKQEKSRNRAAKRESSTYSNRAHSVDSESRTTPSGRSQERRNSCSTASSFDSHGGAAERYQKSQSDTSYSSRAFSITAASSREVLQQPKRKPASTKSQSLRSPSGSSLPEITSFFPKDALSNPVVPARYHSSASRVSQKPASTDQSRIEPAHVDEGLTLAIEAVPEHSSSPITTPQDRSPITPSYTQLSGPSEPFPRNTKHRESLLVSSGSNVLSPPATVKRTPKALAIAFPAGEARPLELPDSPHQSTFDLPLHNWKGGSASNGDVSIIPPADRVQQDLEERPDTSRARLGLRASMIIRTDSMPWESGDIASPRSAGARLSMPNSTRNKTPRAVFGQEK